MNPYLEGGHSEYVGGDDEPIDYIRHNATQRQAYIAKAQVIRERFGDEAADRYLAVQARINQRA